MGREESHVVRPNRQEGRCATHNLIVFFFTSWTVLGAYGAVDCSCDMRMGFAVPAETYTAGPTVPQNKKQRFSSTQTWIEETNLFWKEKSDPGQDNAIEFSNDPFPVLTFFCCWNLQWSLMLDEHDWRHPG